MALVWADGFDHYGNSPAGGRTAMLSMGWLEVRVYETGSSSAMEISNLQSRSGGFSLRQKGSTTGLIAGRRMWATRNIPGYHGGVALSVYIPAFSWYQSLTFFGMMPGLRFLTSNGGTKFRVFINADGSLTLSINSGSSSSTLPTSYGDIIETTSPVLAAGVWQHLEIGYQIDPGGAPNTGVVEVRVNGVTVISVSTLPFGNGPVTVVRIGDVNVSTQTNVSSIPFADLYYDDVISWDSSGLYNNNFLGPTQRVFTQLPDSDTSQADWVLSGAVSSPPPAGYTLIAKNSPNDTTYLEALSNGDISHFGIEDLPDYVGLISGVYVVARMALFEGSARVTVGLVSEGDVIEPPDKLILSGSFSGYDYVMEIDPHTGTPWTLEALNSALLRLHRTL